MATDQHPSPPSQETVAAYEATDYFAHDTPKVRFRIGDGAALHADWLAGHRARSATILTAWNPFGEELDRPANDAAQERLAQTIRAAGLAALPASGEDPRGLWEPEPGFCVFDATPEQVDAWLVEFRQNAVVRIEREQPCALVWHPAIRTAT